MIQPLPLITPDQAMINKYYNDGFECVHLENKMTHVMKVIDNWDME